MACYSTDGYYTAGLCEALLVNLDNYVSSGNVPAMKRSKTGYLDAILSPLNNAGTIATYPIQDGSKKRTVRVKYTTRATESAVSDTITLDCDADYYDDFKEEYVEADQEVSISFGIKEDAVKDVCEGINDLTDLFIMNKLDALSRKVNEKLLTLQATNFGKNYGNGGATTAKTVTVLKADGSPNTGGLQDIIQDYQESNEYVGTPMIVGNGNIAKHLNAIQSGCCNDAGVDLAGMLRISDLQGASYFQDTQATSVWGAQDFAVIAPGTVKFLQWNRYNGDMIKTGTDFSHTTFTDPRNGLVYDLKVFYDKCSEEWRFKISLSYGLFFIPADAWCDDDSLIGTNGTARYTGAQAS